MDDCSEVYNFNVGQSPHKSYFCLLNHDIFLALSSTYNNTALKFN